MRILLIEDDRVLAKLMRMVLSEAGYAVDVTASGDEGRTLASVETYDAVLLDVNLPDRNGVHVLQALRRASNATPIIMVTAQGADSDIVRALDAGADDYIVKPFSNEILRSRVHAAVRRGGAKRSEQLVLGGLLLNRLAREVRLNGTELSLTPREFALLEHLLLHPDEVVTKTQLLEGVWEMTFDPGTNVIEVHVSRIREKMRRVALSPRIATVRGIGFRLTLADVPMAAAS